MEINLVDTAILSPAMDVAQQEQRTDAEHMNQIQVSRETTYESRLDTASRDLANIPVDYSGSSTDMNLQKSLLAAYNGGLGAIVNDRY